MQTSAHMTRALVTFQHGCGTIIGKAAHLNYRILSAALFCLFLAERSQAQAKPEPKSQAKPEPKAESKATPKAEAKTAPQSASKPEPPSAAKSDKGDKAKSVKCVENTSTSACTCVYA